MQLDGNRYTVGVTRRELFEILAAASAAAVSASAGYAAETTVRLTPLFEDVAVITGAGGNMLVHRTRDGLLLIDSGLAESTGAVRFTIKGFSPLPVVYLINTHWHSDHTGGNPVFGAAGAEIIAQKNCLARLSTKQYMAFLDRTVSPLPAEGLPGETFEGGGELSHGNEIFRYRHLPPAHTDGDATIHLENADIYHCGDLFFNGLYPFIDYSSDGSMEGMVSAAEKILKEVENKTTLIPGHGPVATRRELQAFRDMMAAVEEKLSKLLKQGKTLDQVQAASPTAAYDAQWGKGMFTGGDWVRMLYQGESGTKHAANRQFVTDDVQRG